MPAPTTSAKEMLAARAALGATQGDFAALLGVHSMTVSKWERETLWPTSWQLALARALAGSPRAVEILAHYQAAGLAAALAVGLEYKLVTATA